MQLSTELNLAKALALAAGQQILQIYQSSNIIVNHKADLSPVTAADVLAEQIILSGIKQTFPHHNIVSEETQPAAAQQSDWIWFVDPLDGTKDFLAYNNEFTVNIGLTYKGKPVLGVIYAPALDEFYWAVKGGKAYWQKNSHIKKIQVSKRHQETELRIVVSRHHLEKKEKQYLAQHHFAEIKPVGSSLKGCLIARGEADLYIRFVPINQWDICAMHTIIEAAGGQLLDSKNSPVTYRPQPILIQGLTVINSR